MKKLFVCMLFIAFFIQLCPAALTTSITDSATYKNAYRWTGQPGADKILAWATEMEGLVDGTSTTGVASIVYTPGTQPTSTEGRLYYDSATNKLKYYDGGSWVALDAGTAGNSLDEAYNQGQVITVDNGTIAITTGAASNNAAITLAQADSTNNPKAFVLTNAGSGNTIDIQGTSGNDIQGTDDSWAITTAGAATLVGITNTADVLFNSTYDVAWDTNRNQLILEDNAVLGLGGAHDAAADVTLKWDATNLLIEAAADDTGIIKLGATNSMDLTIYGSTATDIASFDAGAGALLLDSYPIALGDGDAILFGDTLGTGDFTISDASDVLTIDNVVDGTGTVSLGTSGAGIDVLFYGDAGSGLMTWDENQNTNGALVFNNADIELGDADFIQFGDTTDATLQWNATLLKMDAVTETAGPAIQIETTNGGITLNADGVANGDIVIDAGDTLTLTNTTKIVVDGVATQTIEIEGTANTEEVVLHFVDPTADITWKFPDGTADTLAIMGSTLETNYPEILNSVTGGTNQLIFEGTADAFETIVTANDATADATISLPNDTGDVVYAPIGVVDYAAGAGALPVTHTAITYASQGGAEALTLADGQPGQVLHVVHDTDGGNGVITPATALGYTSIDLADAGDMVTFQFVDTQGWIIIGTAGNVAPPVVTP